MRTSIFRSSFVALVAPTLLGQVMEWSSDFAPRGTTAAASDAIVFDDGFGPELFLTGSLGAAGPHANATVAAWNGSEWRKVSAVLQPTQSATTKIDFVEVFDSGSGPELYVAGFFTGIDGAPARSIAKRSAGGWTAVGGNDSPFEEQLHVTALEVVDDGSGPALYVGHLFNSIAGQPGTWLSKWDGARWSSVGGALTGRVTGVAAFNDGSGVKLYVCGQALTATGTPGFSSVLVRNGTSWSNVGGAVNGVVERLVVHDDGAGLKLFAAGYSAGAVVGVAHWSGVNWVAVGPAPIDGIVTELAVVSLPSGPRLVAGGTFAGLGQSTSRGLALWDGLAWNNVGAEGLVAGSSLGGVASAIASGDLRSGPRVFVSGSFTRVDSVSAFNVASWDGSAFGALGLGGGLSSGSNTLATFDGSVYVGGAFSGASGSTRSYLARWTGVDWDDAAPSVNGTVESLQSFDSGQGEELFVAGVFTESAPNHFRWDGAQVDSSDALSANGRIFAQLVHDDGSGPVLYVGGRFSSIGGVAATNVARRSGSSWSRLGALEPNNLVNALAVHDDGAGGGPQLYAGGQFLQAGGQFVFGIARYNGASWSPVGGGFDSSVSALAVHDDGSGPQLYAGGWFSTAPPYSTPRIARWDGVRWWPVGAGFDSAVQALAVFDDGSGPALVAGGHFTLSGGLSMRRLARWTGSSWSEFGGGASFHVNELKVLVDGSGLGQALWVAGEFVQVGDVVSVGVARWGRTCTPRSYCTSGTSSSGCTPTIAGTGRASASQTSNLLLNASSLEGARSGHFFYGLNGAHAAPWGQSSHVLCVRAPTQRTATQTTGGAAGTCEGTMSFDWNTFAASHSGALGQPFTAGQDVWAQCYFRDPAGPKTTALSNGVRFTICP